MRGFLRSLAGEGRAVLVSSHLMAELQDTADHLVVVGRGKVIADTTVAELIAAASGDRVSLRTTALVGRDGRAGPARAPPSRPPAATRSPSPGCRPSASWPSCPAAGCRSRRCPRTAPRSRRPTWSSPGTRSSSARRAGVVPPDQQSALPCPRAPRRRRNEHRHDDSVPVRPAARTRRLPAPAAGRVDQVPHRARLGDRHGRRRGADRGGRGGPRGHGQRGQERGGQPGHHRRPGRRGGHRQLLLRAPVARRQRQHHRPGHLAAPAPCSPGRCPPG